MSTLDGLPSSQRRPLNRPRSKSAFTLIHRPQTVRSTLSSTAVPRSQSSFIALYTSPSPYSSASDGSTITAKRSVRIPMYIPSPLSLIVQSHQRLLARQRHLRDQIAHLIAPHLTRRKFHQVSADILDALAKVIVQKTINLTLNVVFVRAFLAGTGVETEEMREALGHIVGWVSGSVKDPLAWKAEEAAVRWWNSSSGASDAEDKTPLLVQGSPTSDTLEHSISEAVVTGLVEAAVATIANDMK